MSAHSEAAPQEKQCLHTWRDRWLTRCAECWQSRAAAAEADREALRTRIAELEAENERLKETIEVALDSETATRVLKLRIEELKGEKEAAEDLHRRHCGMAYCAAVSAPPAPSRAPASKAAPDCPLLHPHSGKCMQIVPGEAPPARRYVVDDSRSLGNALKAASESRPPEAPEHVCGASGFGQPEDVCPACEWWSKKRAGEPPTPSGQK